jgi:methionyl-tRNA formyltransferase
VAAFAREHNLPLWQTTTLRGADALDRLRAAAPDAMALAAFAALVPKSVLELAPGGVLNVHPSLLPRWRGAAPIQAVLLAGDVVTGVSIIRLVQALDAGPILLQERLKIADEDDYLTLEPRLAALGARLLVRALAEEPLPTAQDDSQATYCQRIERDDARLDWSLPAVRLWRQVRAYRDWPQAFTRWEGRQLKVLRAWPVLSIDGVPGTVALVDGAPVVAAGDGALRLDEVVPEGRRPQSGAEFLRGYPRFVGSRVA